MPTYDYHCQKCEQTFELRLSIQEHDRGQVRCPHCQSPQIEQVVTHFETVTSKKS